MTNRRIFLTWLPAAGAALAGGKAAAQSPPPMVDEKEPQAVALGYVHDAKRVNKAKFPKYAPPQACANCQFYVGAATLPTAPCTLFAGKRVAGPGWCSAWVPKKT